MAWPVYQYSSKIIFGMKLYQRLSYLYRGWPGSLIETAVHARYVDVDSPNLATLCHANTTDTARIELLSTIPFTQPFEISRTAYKSQIDS